MVKLATSFPPLVLLALLPLVPACNGDPELADPPAAEAPGTLETPGTPRATERPGPTESGAAQSTAGTGPLIFEAQEGWFVEQPANSMRAAQYRLPAAEGAAADADAELVVFHFGSGGGGGFEVNLARWASQFELPDGGSPLEAVRQSSREVAGMSVREVELEGTYVAETSPGSGQRVNEPGWALRAAVIEAPTGPYYVKLVGPQSTVERWEDSYRAFVGAVRPGR